MSKKKDGTQVINNIGELKFEIDYDKLAEAIVKSREIEKEKVIKKKNEELIKWKKDIGVNTHEDKKGIKRKFFVFGNNIKIFFKLIFFSSKNKVRISITGAFIQGITAVFFHLIKFILWILSLAFISIAIYHGNMLFSILDYVFHLGLAFVAFLLASIFRIMAIEVEQMNDRERVLGIFTAVMSIIPMIELITDLFKEVL